MPHPMIPALDPSTAREAPCGHDGCKATFTQHRLAAAYLTALANVRPGAARAIHEDNPLGWYPEFCPKHERVSGNHDDWRFG